MSLPNVSEGGRSTRSTRNRSNRRQSARFEPLLEQTENQANTSVAHDAPSVPSHVVPTPPTSVQPTIAAVDPNLSDYIDSGGVSDTSDNYAPPKSTSAGNISSKRGANKDPATNPAKRARANGKKKAPLPVDERLQGIGPVPARQEPTAAHESSDNDNAPHDWGSLTHKSRGERKGQGQSPIWKYVYGVNIDPADPHVPIPRCPADAPTLTKAPDGFNRVACRICNGPYSGNSPLP